MCEGGWRESSLGAAGGAASARSVQLSVGTSWVRAGPSRCLLLAHPAAPTHPPLATAACVFAGQLVFHSRTLDDNAIKAGYVLEEEYQRAASGEWVPKHRCAWPPAVLLARRCVRVHGGDPPAAELGRVGGQAKVGQTCGHAGVALEGEHLESERLAKHTGGWLTDSAMGWDGSVSCWHAPTLVPLPPSLLRSGVAGMPLPGLYSRQPLVSGITGLSALNPSLAALATNNPGVC